MSITWWNLLAEVTQVQTEKRSGKEQAGEAGRKSDLEALAGNFKDSKKRDQA